MKYYRLMSSLPAMPQAPEPPPIRLTEMVPALRVDLTEGHWTLAEALLLSFDMNNVEAMLVHRDAPLDPRALATGPSVFPGSELPQFAADLLRRGEEGSLSASEAIPAVWRGYYGYLADLSETSGVEFLRQFVGFELPLRNALYRQRAERLGMDASSQLLEEPSGGARHDELLARLAEESEPLAREKLLDTARLRAFDSFSGTDPFSIDAVMAYVASAIVLDRWDLPRTADTKEMLEVFA